MLKSYAANVRTNTQNSLASIIRQNKFQNAIKQYKVPTSTEILYNLHVRNTFVIEKLAKMLLCKTPLKTFHAACETFKMIGKEGNIHIKLGYIAVHTHTICFCFVGVQNEAFLSSICR